MTTNWVEEGTLADMKHRLEKLRIDQSRQRPKEEPGKKDTLKILQSKFGSPVYDPTSPLQKAYDRRYARSGRRKSIEFEDLYLRKGSGLLQLPSSPGSPKAPQASRCGDPHASKWGSAGPRKHPLGRSSSGADYSGQLATLQRVPQGRVFATRSRKSSDPTSQVRRGAGGGDHNLHSKTRSGTSVTSEHTAGGQKVGQGESEGQKGRGQRGILHVTLSEEERRAIDRKLAGMEGVEEEGGGSHHVMPRKKKVSKSGPRP
ncbi:hypothetical protein ACOMHN_020053 [Nucella lapillus]